jgi:type I restriction enzyme M protein
MLPMTVLRRFDCVLAGTKEKVLRRYEQLKTKKKLEGKALDSVLDDIAGQKFHNHSPLYFEKMRGAPDSIKHDLVSYINGFSENIKNA